MSEGYFVPKFNGQVIGEIAGVRFVSPIVFQNNISPDAAVIFKKTSMEPSASFMRREKVTKLRFTALSMSSTHIKMTMALRRVRTPITPSENIAALMAR